MWSAQRRITITDRSAGGVMPAFPPTLAPTPVVGVFLFGDALDLLGCTQATKAEHAEEDGHEAVHIERR